MPTKLRDIEPAPNIDPQLGLLLAMLEDGTREWRREFKELALPQAAISWRPHEGFASIGNIITHMAAAESRWVHEMAQRRQIAEADLMKIFSESIDFNNQNFQAPPDEPIEWYWNHCDKVRDQSIGLIHQLADPKLVTERSEKDYGYTLRWILHHVITHEAYHGGQVVTLGMLYKQAHKST